MKGLSSFEESFPKMVAVDKIHQLGRIPPYDDTSKHQTKSVSHTPRIMS